MSHAMYLTQVNKIMADAIRLGLTYNPITGLFHRKGKVAGCKYKTQQGKSYIRISLNYKKYNAHRLAFVFMNGRFPLYDVDHNNGDGTDNRWCNLSSKTVTENPRNRRLLASNKSGCSGVAIMNNRFRAQIKVNKKIIHLGCFGSYNDAVIAKKMAEYEHGFSLNHGEVRPL